MRRLCVLASLALFLAGFVWSVRIQEDRIAYGETLVVRLAPRDPRAFLLGDYMAVNYAMNRELDAALARRYAGARGSAPGGAERSKLPRDGLAVVRLDASRMASFVRLDDGAPLRNDERRLYFRVRAGGARIAAPAFYFQEGRARDFERAVYGELRVDAEGSSLLVHMLDRDLQRIHPRKILTAN